MIKIAHRKDEVQHAKDDKLELHEIKALMHNLKGSHKFIFTALLYGGMRVGELVHMRSSRIHIDDEYSKSQGYNYIQIPLKGQKCDCDQCLLNAYISHVRDDQEKSKEWYRNVRAKFYMLKGKGKLPVSEGLWRPKSKKSSRRIPILMDEFRDELLSFYSKHDSLGMIRQQVGEIVKRESNTILGRHLYPHAIRATTASLWVDSGLNITSLMKTMGWETMNTAQIYIDASDKQAIEDAQRKASVFEQLIN